MCAQDQAHHLLVSAGWCVAQGNLRAKEGSVQLPSPAPPADETRVATEVGGIDLHGGELRRRDLHDAGAENLAPGHDRTDRRAQAGGPEVTTSAGRTSVRTPPASAAEAKATDNPPPTASVGSGTRPDPGASHKNRPLPSKTMPPATSPRPTLARD